MPTLTAPTLTATADDAAARVALVVGIADPVTGTVGVTVERSTDAGATWTAVRAATGLTYTAASTATIYDYEHTGIGTTRYQARVFDAAVPATVGSWSTPVDVVAEVRTWWLRDSITPATGTALTLEWASVSLTRRRDQGVFAPLGSARHVVVNGARRGELIAFTVICDGAAALDTLDGVLDTGRVLLLRDDAGHLWYVVAGPDRPAELQPTADRSERPIYRVPLTFQEVAAP
jgi:hypothetical protein